MGGRLVRYQIIAFALVTVLGISYAMIQYVGLGPILGAGRFHVSVELPDTGGLYTGADVTDRGVTIGRVSAITVHRGGVTADVSIDDGTRISATGLTAAVRSVSAVGEQYLEFTPRGSAAPYLETGSVVPASAVSLPPSVTTLLANLNALLRSVPRQKLAVTITELYKAFNGSGPRLRQLLDSATDLLAAAQRNITPTKDLITGLRPVLDTQRANGASVTAFSRNLDALSAKLRDSDPDLSGTLAQLPGFLTELTALTGQLQPTVPLLLANLTSVGQVLEVYLPGVRQALVILPAAINNVTAATMASGLPGTLNADFMLAGNNPPPCQRGYTTQPRDPSDTSPAAAPARASYCDVPHASEQDVRGARNDPCPNNPSVRSATAAGCGLYFGGAKFGDTAQSAGGGSGTYDPASGLLVAPNGVLYSLGASSLHGGPSSLPGLLRLTLGQ